MGEHSSKILSSEEKATKREREREKEEKKPPYV